jgi:hypothetical protein
MSKETESSLRNVVFKYKKFWEELIAYFPLYVTDHIENYASNNSSIVAFVLVIAVTFLPSRCLATRGGYFYRQQDFLSSGCLAMIRGYTDKHTDSNMIS